MDLKFSRLSATDQCPGSFLGMIGRDPSVSKINRVHVDIFRIFFIRSKKIL